MGKPKRIKSPEQLAAERIANRAKELEAVNIPADAASLRHGQDIEVTRQGQKRGDQKADHDTARRLDAFAALKDGMAPGAYDAARRFELSVAVRRGENDRGRPTERVDRTAGITTDAMIQAAEEIENVVARLAPRDWWLLMELIAPRIERASWRETVDYITGERTPHGQCAAVRAACVNLRDAYTAMERRAAA